jgi:hypothetical protein
VGEVTRVAFPALGDDLVHVLRDGAGAAEGTWLRVVDGRPERGWPTDRPGVYRVRADGGGPAALYVVNWPAEEFDLRPIDADGLAARLPGVAVALADSETAAQVAEVAGERLGWPPVAVVLGLILAGVFVGEALLAARRGAAVR